MTSLITELPDQDYSIDTKPYILSNETERGRTIELLSRSKAKEGGIHIGFSCWENFNFMIARGSHGAIIGDISNPAREIHLLTQDCILSTGNRKEFLEKFIYQLNPERHLREKDLREELHRHGSWISTDEGFARIKFLYENRLIQHIRMDVTDTAAAQKVADWMKKTGTHCDSFYLTNIPDWFMNLPDRGESIRKLRQLKFAIGRMIRPETYMIHSSEFFRESSGMPQRVFYLEKGLYDPMQAMTEGK